MLPQNEFYFLRHGQTDANLFPHKRLLLGDVSLNQTGELQAKNIAPFIATLPLKSICVSPFKRTQQTANLSCSQLSGLPRYEIRGLSECHPEIWKTMTQLGEEARHASDERVFSFMQKVYEGLQEALSKPGPVLIVAHGGVHWAICCYLQVQGDWIAENCVPIHFSTSTSGYWRATKLEQVQTDYSYSL